MLFGKFQNYVQQRDAQLGPIVNETGAQPGWWRSTEATPYDHNLLGSKDWTDLAVLVDTDTRLGRAVRVGQRYFTDEELAAALNGTSREVSLTVIDAEPVFVNAAMISEFMTGERVESLTT